MATNISIDLGKLTDWLTAVGTIAVAVMAIWGDKFRDLFAGPRLVLEPKNFKGELTHFSNGPSVIYYHLSVKNKRPWSSAKNVRILLVGILKKKADGNFYRANVFVPQQLTWAPAESHPMFPMISKEDTADFGFLVEKKFRICTYGTPNNFEGHISANSTMRVELEIVADNFISRKYDVFEISWDGVWTDNLGEMEKHLVIKQINDKK